MIRFCGSDAAMVDPRKFTRKQPGQRERCVSSGLGGLTTAGQDRSSGTPWAAIVPI